MEHSASIDLEDWYHDVEHVTPVDDARFKGAFDRQLETIVEILDATSTRCTFFVLGRTAERHPDWIRRLAQGGHELATHGYGHDRLETLSEDSFRADLRRSIGVIAQLTGRRPAGYRAPYFSVRRSHTWFYDVLAEEGLRYSSSVFPFPGRRYGIGDHSLTPIEVETPRGVILEIPMAVVMLGGRRVPIAGGGFWRMAPIPMIDYCIQRLDEEHRPFVMYLHPHEFDPVPLRSHRGLRRNLYVNLGRRSIAGKLRHVLERHRFRPIGDLLNEGAA
jgi:polysaccharide deacetylase family protein (PEP-CTERM system associated)